MAPPLDFHAQHVVDASSVSYITPGANARPRGPSYGKVLRVFPDPIRHLINKDPILQGVFAHAVLRVSCVMDACSHILTE